ncbi:MAG: nucleoside triphosphate pyrophosphohydrolase [Firmicutes bacterium]|nr:nucleoside triphosphate pyrophosphohydrolase [Bacillota bacterium]
MVNFIQKDCYTISDLEEIVRLLRAPGGCPWDREQTHQSIRRNFIEEAYEVAEAIDEGHAGHLKEELGDVLLQVLFHTRIEEEAGVFSLNDVADTVSKKLIFRHPHVFGDVKAEGSDEVLANWEELKRQEKGQATHSDALNSVARSLPALWRAEKIQGKAKKAGFDWPSIDGAMDKLGEELGELQEAVLENSNTREELGDLLFAAVNVARFLSIDPEEALHQASEKFTQRFSKVEEAAAARGRAMEELSLPQLDELWDTVKAKDKQETSRDT